MLVELRCLLDLSFWKNKTPIPQERKIFRKPDRSPGSYIYWSAVCASANLIISIDTLREMKSNAKISCLLSLWHDALGTSGLLRALAHKASKDILSVP